ncbi:MAG: carboxypeptidase regulatory-like domain-containing protein [Gemmatimonadota bacterium]
MKTETRSGREPRGRRAGGVGVSGVALLALAGWLPFLPYSSGRIPAGKGGEPPGPGAAGGRIEGVVHFQGEAPSPEKIEVNQDVTVCGTSILSETFVVSPKNRGLKNVLVTVEGLSGARPGPRTSTATIVQEGCIYRPHFQVVELGAEGTQLLIRNEDGILHNIQASQGGRPLFNSAQPGILKEIKKKLTRPGLVEIKCDVHGWMEAHIVVLEDQPYYAVTSEEGRFAIEGVPAGTYTLHAWHEALGEMTRRVTVADGGTATVDFVIKPGG